MSFEGVPSNYWKILELLISKTIENKVNWTEASSNSYRVKFKEYSVLLGEGSEFGGYFLSLFDANGEYIDGFSVPEGDSEVAALHDAARRKARNIDQALGDIEAELSSEGSVGLPDDNEELPF